MSLRPVLSLLAVAVALPLLASACAGDGQTSPPSTGGSGGLTADGAGSGGAGGLVDGGAGTGGAAVDGPLDRPGDGPADHPPLDGPAADAGVDAAPRPRNGPIAIPAAAWSRDIAEGSYTDGAPIGGLGAGTITWRFDGAFYTGRLDIGSSDMQTEPADAFFAYQRAGTAAAVTKRLDRTELQSGQARYHALFPRAWVDYGGAPFPCRMKVEQLTPAIPGDYRRTSYPVGVYRWEITNPTTEACDAAVMLTWRNPWGASAQAVSDGEDVGLVLRRSGSAAATAETEGEFTLASRAAAGVTISVQSAGSAGELRTAFADDGLLAGTTGNHTTGAIAFKTTVAPGGRALVPIVLAWDLPIAQAETRDKWYREYTRHFGRSGQASWTIAREALESFPDWQLAIDDWQAGVLASPRYPDWLKTMLFNELYQLFVGGTYWEAGAASGQPDDPDEDMFTTLESFLYPFYGTADVRFYGSWPLAMLWPDIDKQEVKQFCDSVVNTRADRPPALGTCAHDFGTTGSVFRVWNAYTYRDTTEWKDLNSKLVLMVYRDWALTGKSDSAFLGYCWPAVQAAMAKVRGQDTDGDGLPNSTGIDQTYDNLSLRGNTAYCGSLFLAASLAAKEMATAMGQAALASTYQGWFDEGRASFDSKLWEGSYYNIDTGSTDPTRIMADQLAGEWYSRACGLPPIVDPARASAAFRKIYDFNFSRFANGTRGVVNVMTAAGAVDSSTQGRECWVGTSWGIVAGMIQEGLETEAVEIGQSLYDTIWVRDALWFRTPEAWDSNGQIRAPYYMRGPTVWAVKRAYDLTP